MTDALGGLRVVELLGSPAGGYAGRLFAGWGASVTLTEVSDTPVHPRDTALAAYLDHAKHRTAVDRAGLAELAGSADVLIESSSPAPLSPLVGDRAGLVRVQISPLGGVGPAAQRWSTELTDQARSGHLLLNGDPDREPVAGPDHQVHFAAGLHGFIGAMAALHGGVGSGRTIEVNHLQVMASLHQFTLIRRINGGDLLRRMGNRWAGPGRPCGLYRCRDGFVSIIVPRDDQLERLLAVTDLVHLLAEPGIEHAYDLMHHPSLLDDHLRPWFSSQKVDDAVTLLQEVRVPAAPVSTMADLLADEHLAVRSSMVEVNDLVLPGPPARIGTTPWRTRPSSNGDMPAAVRAAPPPDPAVREPSNSGTPPRPLAGVRIVDLTRVWAGPLATRVLADLGADVVMVEAPWARGGPTIDRTSVVATAYYPDNEPGREHWNRIGFVNKYALGKRSVALDLSDAAGAEALTALLADADVVIENFSPRVMPQLGFDEHRLRELNPDLIYVTMPGYGRTGPDRDRVAYGPIVDAHAGLASLMGYPGEPARSAGIAWPDPIAGLHAAAATLVALHQRARDGHPEVVEVAQIEATIAMVGAALARYQLDGQLPVASGNQRPGWGLQAVVACAGEDRWVAISATDEGVERLRRAIEVPQDLDAIETHHALARWAVELAQDEVVERLAEPGIAVAAVADAQQVLDDPQLAALDAWTSSLHPAAGPELWPRTALTIDGHSLEPARPAPMLGEHNRQVVDNTTQTEADYNDLIARGVLATSPPE